MALEEQYTTFNDLYTAVLNAVRSQTSQASTTSQAKRAVNVALQDMHLGQDYQFYWAEREATLLLDPPYSTGTVAITQSDSTVTGTGTMWDAFNVHGNVNVIAGSKMKFAGSEVVYRITGTPTTTELEISPNYIGTTLTEGTYSIFNDEYALPSDYLRPVEARFFDDNREIILKDRRQMKRAVPRNSMTGRPRWATQIELGPSGSTAMRPRIVMAPPPDQAYVIPYSYITNQLVVASDGTLKKNFSLDTDEPIVPLRYRHAIYYYALKMFYEHKDDARAQTAENDYNRVMMRTLNDVSTGDRRMRVEPQIGHYEHHAERPYSGRGRSPRFDSNNAFDRME